MKQSSLHPTHKTYHFSASLRYFDLCCFGSACLSTGLEQMWNDSLPMRFKSRLSALIWGYYDPYQMSCSRTTDNLLWTCFSSFSVPIFDHFKICYVCLFLFVDYSENISCQSLELQNAHHRFIFDYAWGEMNLRQCGVWGWDKSAQVNMCLSYLQEIFKNRNTYGAPPYHHSHHRITARNPILT